MQERADPDAGAPEVDDSPGTEQPELPRGAADERARAGPASHPDLQREDAVRWQLLLDAVVTLAADLSLSDLLTRITQIAADLIHARYAALGVLADDGERLGVFITHGIPPEDVAKIGDPPVGHGFLGHVIAHPEPLRLHDLTTHPESVGVPAHHPVMHSFLGVPIRSQGRVFGNLYLSEKVSGDDFTHQDEEILVALSAAAGVAIANAKLHEQAARRERWLAAAAEISTVLLMDDDEDTPQSLQTVADWARDLAGADAAWILTGPEPDRLRVRVVSGVPIDPARLTQVPLRRSLASAAVRAGEPLLIEDTSARAAEVSASDVFDLSDFGPALVVPLPGAESDDPHATSGALSLAWRHENAAAAHEVDLRLPTAFAEQAALAIRVARARADRERLAVYDDRDRIGRDLHDLVIQRLFAIGLDLQGALRRCADPAISTRLDAAVEEIDSTIKEIRRTIFALSSMDASDDVQSALTEVVRQATGSLRHRPRLEFEGAVRLRIPLSLTPELVAVLREALSNISRHASASAVSIVLRADDAVRLTVVDDGTGIAADATPGRGLANMRERARRRGGECTVRPGDGCGTVVEWTVPIAP